MNSLHASTKPLEALKHLISDVATRASDTFKEEEVKVIMVNDVARAYLEAKVERSIAIELPDEDKADGQDMLGILEMSLYGTRDAALNFQKEVRKFMKSKGFVMRKYNSCTYLNKAKGIKVMVHGDDFVSSGSRSSLKWFKAQLEKRFEVKTKGVGKAEERCQRREFWAGSFAFQHKDGITSETRDTLNSK